MDNGAVREPEDEKFFFNKSFGLHRDFLIAVSEPKDYRPFDPKKALFFYWKRVSWVNPLDAAALGYALTHGFEDKVVINPEWGNLWYKRSALLKQRKREWYIPQNDSMFKPRPHYYRFDNSHGIK